MVEQVSEYAGDVYTCAVADCEEQNEADYHAAHEEHDVCGSYYPGSLHEPGAEEEADDCGGEGREKEELVAWEADETKVGDDGGEVPC